LSWRERDAPVRLDRELVHHRARDAEALRHDLGGRAHAQLHDRIGEPVQDRDHGREELQAELRRHGRLGAAALGRVQGP
jgi:hypothetical protein